MYQDDDEYEGDEMYENDEEDYTFIYDDEDAEDMCVDDSVWDTRTQKFTTRSEVWCAFEDDE